MLLRVAEAEVANPPDPEEVVARAKEAAEREANDAEVVWLYGNSIQRAGRSYEATPIYLHALELDPRFAEALCETDYPDMDLNLRNLERCLEISPRAASCLRTRDAIYVDRGRCEDFDADTRRLVVIEPSGTRAYLWRAIALAQERAPLDAIREALDKRASLELTDARKIRDSAEEQIWLGLLVGDFALAQKATRELDARGRDQLSEQDHYEAFSVMLDTLLETGDLGAALQLGDDYEHRSRAWTADRPLGMRMRIAYLRHHAGRLDERGFERARQELVDEAVRLGIKPGEAWRATYARDAETADDARAALAALPEGPLETAAGHGLVCEALGHALLLAGRPGDALPWLRQAASSCAAMVAPVNFDLAEGLNTVHYVRAHLWLGEALEQTGDGAGACAAYAEVVTRWGRPRPGSVTVDETRTRMKKLGCADGSPR
jgi:tetratricopeptide (TPR) repeat protein